MVKRALGLGLFLALAAPGPVSAAPDEPVYDAPRPWSQPLFFVKDGPKRHRAEIRDAIGSKGLGSSEHETRVQARTTLARLGEIPVEALAKAVMGSGKVRVRMNAAIVLAEIGSSRGAEAFAQALRNKAGDTGFGHVVPALGLGLFARPRDVDLLDEVAQRRKKWSAVAATLALAKMPGRQAAAKIRTRRDSMPRRATHAAATWLAAALLLPDAAPELALKHKDRIVRMAAAVALCIRPRESARAPLLEALEKRERDEVRTLLVHALAAQTRDDVIRERLLELAKGKKLAAHAALRALADERGHKNQFEKLRKIQRATKSIDVRHGPLMLAMLRTGHSDAPETVYKVAAALKPAAYAAVGALILELARDPDTKQANRILDRFYPLQGRTGDKRLKELLKTATSVASTVEGRSARARALVRELATEWERDLWLRDRDQLSFAILNRFLPRLFELDQLVERADPSHNDPGRPGGIRVDPNAGAGSDTGGDDTRKAVSADPDEQDLNDFLTSRPYFSKRDRRAAR